MATDKFFGCDGRNKDGSECYLSITDCGDDKDGRLSRAIGHEIVDEDGTLSGAISFRCTYFAYEFDFTGSKDSGEQSEKRGR